MTQHNTIANIKQHIENGDHVHLYGDHVERIALDVLGKDEPHIDLMPQTVAVYGEDYLKLNSNQGDIYIDADALAFHVPNQP